VPLVGGLVKIAPYLHQPRRTGRDPETLARLDFGLFQNPGGRFIFNRKELRMSDQSRESAPEATEASAPTVPATQPPTPKLSTPSAGPATSTGNQDVDFSPRQLLAIEAAIERSARRFQSDKDRGQAKLDQRLTNIERLAERLGVPQEKVAAAQREEEIDQALQAWRQGQALTSPASDPGRSAQAELERRAAEILTQHNVPFNDPKVAEIAATAKDEIDYFTRLSAFAATRAAGQTVPAGAAISENNGAPPNQGASVETLTRKFKEEMQAARGKGYRFGDEIKAKYRSLGVDVDNISFSA
jgi:hypothetical protein